LPLKSPEPVFTAHLFPELLEGLLNLLSGLTSVNWAEPIPRKSWSVKDVALHLLGGDVGVLSRHRNGCITSGKGIHNYEELVSFLKTQNDTWIESTRRLSPRLLCDLLRFTGEQVSAYVQSVDPNTLVDPVSWAGPDAAPAWFGIAREYTERWHHQQHIREAVARRGYTTARYLKPALATFMRALPRTCQDVRAQDGRTVCVTISGDAGDTWLLVRERNRWGLYVGDLYRADAEVTIPQEIAWKLFTKWFPKQEALMQSKIQGDQSLALRVFEMIAVIA